MVFYLKIQSFEVTQNTNHTVGWLVFNSTFSTKSLYQCHAKIQGDHSPDNVKGYIMSDNVKFPGGSRHSSTALGMLSVTHVMPVLVLLSVVGVLGMQHYMIGNHILNI